MTRPWLFLGVQFMSMDIFFTAFPELYKLGNIAVALPASDDTSAYSHVYTTSKRGSETPFSTKSFEVLQ